MGSLKRLNKLIRDEQKIFAGCSMKSVPKRPHQYSDAGGWVIEGLNESKRRQARRGTKGLPKFAGQ